MTDKRMLDLLTESLKETKEALEYLIDLDESGEVQNIHRFRASSDTPLTYRVVMNLESQGLVKTSTYVDVDNIRHLRVTDVWATALGIEYVQWVNGYR